jgi:uncharacterized protein
MKFLRFVLFGSLFGFILSRVGATDYNAISDMFRLRDLHLMGVIGGAVVVAGLGLRFLKHRQTAGAVGGGISFKNKQRKPGNIVGGVIFGIGWAITGTCPGTGLAQLGEGKMMALFTVAGMFLGAALYRRLGSGIEAALSKAPTAPESAGASKALGHS